MHRSLTLLIYVFLPVLVAVSVVRVSLIFFCVLFIDIQVFFFFFLMIRRPPRSTHCISSAASDVYKRQVSTQSTWVPVGWVGSSVGRAADFNPLVPSSNLGRPTSLHRERRGKVEMKKGKIREVRKRWEERKVET
eukprot:TRINITY_DN2662_c0_g1_i2.p1 TRINITY_DN2662_c0_g1~~TRINITY_DN2662_c0_g1_i2.p1  ORF type:complete len:135 (+),score=20.06 TRINITY_DN2662_c0_g1_i2:10-414(+)